MSKSDDNTNGFISLSDNKDRIISKFKKAVTDSDMEIRYDKEKKPGISNLLEIYSCATGKSIKKSEFDFKGISYKNFKLAVGESVVNVLIPIQEEFQKLCKDKSYVNNVLKDSNEKAFYLARKTLEKVKRKIGFYKI